MEKIKNMEKIKRDSMIIYRSVCDLIRALPAETRLEMYDAMIDYGLDGVERALDGLEKAILNVAKPLIDANNRRYDKKRRAHQPRQCTDTTAPEPQVSACQGDFPAPCNEQRTACVSCNCSHTQSAVIDKGTAATQQHAESEREPQQSFAAEVADMKKSLIKQVNTKAGKGTVQINDDTDFNTESDFNFDIDFNTDIENPCTQWSSSADKRDKVAHSTKDGWATESVNKKSNTNTNKNVNKNSNVNVNENANKNANENANANVYYNTATSSPGRARARETHFEAPSVEEVAAYCRERNNRVDAQRFVDFYTSKGWRVGKNSMVNWKAALRLWESNDDPVRHPSPASFVGGTVTERRHYTDEEINSWFSKLEEE